MGKASRERRERRLVKAAVDHFAAEIEEKVAQKSLDIGYLRGLEAAAECKTIKEVRTLYMESIPKEDE